MSSGRSRTVLARAAACACITASAVALAGTNDGARPGPGVAFVGSFKHAEVAEHSCSAWNSFRAKLDGRYSSITLAGSKDPVGRTCTGAAANTLCRALRRGDPVVDLQCDGHTWNVDYCSEQSWELSADGTACSCVGNYDVRPCIASNGDWGGIAGPVCASGHNEDQTITVVCR
jgi:hypothetical protein